MEGIQWIYVGDERAYDIRKHVSVDRESGCT